jgi:hypothetical protein
LDFAMSGFLDTARHCRDQAAEHLRLMKSARNADEVRVLRNISQSWSRLAGQLDRYEAMMRRKSSSEPRTVSSFEPQRSSGARSAGRLGSKGYTQPFFGLAPADTIQRQALAVIAFHFEPA